MPQVQCTSENRKYPLPAAFALSMNGFNTFLEISIAFSLKLFLIDISIYEYGHPKDKLNTFNLFGR